MKKILRSTIGKSLLACSFFSVTMFTSSDVMAQSGVGINGTGAPANSSAGLDVDFSNKGVLIPRIALTSTTDVTTIPTPANSLLVFNTTNGAGLTPGFYYYDGNLMQWTAVAGSGGGGGGGGAAIVCSSPAEDKTLVYNNGQWECNDVLEVDPTWNAVSINNFSGPSSSYNLLVSGNVGIDGAGTPSSSYELSVGGQGHFTNEVGIGTTPSTSYDLRVDGNVGIGFSPSSSYDLSVDGDIACDNIGIGVAPSTSYKLYTSGNVRLASTGTQGVSSSWYTVLMNSSGDVKRNSAASSSSRQFKTNIQDLTFNKEKFLQLRPRTFTYKKYFGGHEAVGLIAEEVNELMPELVRWAPKRTFINEDGEPLLDENGNEVISETEEMIDGVHYDMIPVYLISVVSDQDKLIQSQQAEIAELKARLDKQEAMITRLVEAIPASKGSNVLPDNTLKAEVEKSRK